MAHYVELLSRSELAGRFGVDIRTITNWINAGLPQRSRRGELVYAWQECREWREAAIREDARNLRHAGGNAEKAIEKAELELRRLRSEAEQAELDLAERRGALVTVEYMAAEFERISQSMRAHCLAIPSSWAGRLDKCRTTIDRQLVLRECVNELLPALGESALTDDVQPAETEPKPRRQRTKGSK